MHTCSTCRSKVSQEQIKFDFSGVNLVCDSCFSKKQGFEQKRRTGRIDDTSIIEERRFLKRAQEDSINYQCLDCKYKFSRKKSFNICKCPYCSGAKVAQVYHDQAKQILNSITD